jgi:PAS domain S-box-containing protein
MEPAKDVTRWASSPGDAPAARPRPSWLVAACGGGTMALGVLVIILWLLGHPTAASLGTGRAYMKFNVALAFVLAGLSLVLSARRVAGGPVRVLAAMAGALGLLSTIETLTHIDLGIDFLLVPGSIAAAAHITGRMSLMTSAGFMLFAIGSLAGSHCSRWSNICQVAATLLGLATASLASLLYLYHAPYLNRPGGVFAISAPTAIGLQLLFIGLMATRPELGWMGQMRSPTAGGALFRWLLPLLIAFQPAIGYVRMRGQTAGLYDTQVGSAVFTTIAFMFVSSFVWLAARQADRWDAERQHAWIALSASERRLQEASEQLRAVIDASPVAIMAFDAARNVTLWNRMAETVFGYTAAELLGKPAPAAFDAGAPDFQPHKAGAVPTKLRRKDGQVLEAVSSFAAMFDTTGAVRGTVVAVTDLTEHNALEHRLQVSQKMEAIGKLTGGLAHDFNNLLGVVLGNLDILQEGQAPESEAWQLTDAAIHAAVRGAELTRQLLAFARQQPLAPKLIDLNGLLEGTARLLRRTLGEQIALELAVPDPLWPACLDASQLESAILNLAVNARDAMPGGGRLTLEARNVTLDANAELTADASAGDYIAFAISDTGTGMPPEIIAKVFEPFFSTKGNAGTGLGLSMVHGFVKQSGGHTKIYSEVGRGTTIRMYLPRASTGQPEAEPPASAPNPAKNSEVILVVEDNKALRDVALHQLHSLGYRTLPAADAGQALDLLREGTAIDLLFTDVIMPGGMDGRDLAAEARRLRPGLKILFTSGFTAAAASAAMQEDFGQNLLSKPYRKDELGRRIRAAIDSLESANR